eukprot:TRINITY_DN1191_c7_g1_i1.p1 TRINITY_DN1191_c7_g1~~TRINITY_DN1191_c7_g1_i1.p1  ORF type:complete len:494 (+),score=162.92 TRINITY_DN1191_c7_g1_i1:64-1545(+)
MEVTGYYDKIAMEQDGAPPAPSSRHSSEDEMHDGAGLQQPASFGSEGGSVDILVEALFDRSRCKQGASLDALAREVREAAQKTVRTFHPGKDVGVEECYLSRRSCVVARVDDSLEIGSLPCEAVRSIRVNAAFLEDGHEAISDLERNVDMFQDSCDDLPACELTPLPHVSLVGLWESLCFDDDSAPDAHPGWCGHLKHRLLRYMLVALLLSDKGVDPTVVSWNRVILFYGPPGTGKTSVCRALAQKLSMHLRHRFPICQLVEINTHSIFSKFFSESGKLVMKLFMRVRELAEDTSTLIILLIDEVESLAGARTSSLNSGDPSDSIRVVNALLTQIDALRRYPNVFILCTSNITEAIDIAFVDRADQKVFLGPPSLRARYRILSGAVNELLAKNVVSGDPLRDLSVASRTGSSAPEGRLYEMCSGLEGASGRFLRKLPFLSLMHSSTFTLQGYFCGLARAVADEAEARQQLTRNAERGTALQRAQDCQGTPRRN